MLVSRKPAFFGTGMSKNDMCVHLYRVFAENESTPFEQLIGDTLALSLDKRSRIVGTTDMRLEFAVAPKSEGNSSKFWLLDFVKIRFASGPGKANRDDPIEGFELAEGDGFGEETAALYDPVSRHMLVQYNHHGPRAFAIPTYFAACLGDATPHFTLNARSDTDAEMRFQNSKIVRRLEFKVCPPSSAILKAKDASLDEVIGVGNRLGGASITVTIAAERGGFLDFLKVRHVVDALMKGASSSSKSNKDSNATAVESVKVVTKPTAEAPAEAIDLLSPKLELEVGGLSLGSDLRFTRQSRWNALLQAREYWAHTVKS